MDVTTFSRQLDKRQFNCKDNWVKITNDDKVEHFGAQMYACGLFEAKLLGEWEETANKLRGATHPHLTRKFNKERRKLESEKSQKNYESSAVFRKDPHLHTFEISQGMTTATTTDSSFTSAMYYATALEEKSIT